MYIVTQRTGESADDVVMSFEMMSRVAYSHASSCLELECPACHEVI